MMTNTLKIHRDGRVANNENWQRRSDEWIKLQENSRIKKERDAEQRERLYKIER